MHLYISFISFIITSFAAENIFTDDGVSAGFGLGADSSLNPIPSDNEAGFNVYSVPLDNFNTAVSNQPLLFDDAQPLNEFSISASDPVIPGDGQDSNKSLFDSEDEISTALSENDASLDLALDPCQASPVTKKRLKSRDASCSNKAYFPENFRSLGTSLQEKIFRQFICPTEGSLHVGETIPVCSSRMESNNLMTSLPTSAGPELHYILHDSFLCTCCADLLWVIMSTNPFYSGLE